MAKLRNLTQGFTVVPQTITKDTRLGLRAMGLLVKMLSLPDNCELSEKGLAAIVKENLTTIGTDLKYLEFLGYLKRVSVRDAKGRITSSEWEIFSESQYENLY